MNQKGGFKKLLYSQKIAPYVFILPFILTFLIFFTYPLFDAIVMSFQKVSARGNTWIGLKNYKTLLNPVFFKAVKNSVIYTIVTLLLMIPIPMVLAALLKNYREQVEIKYQPDFYNIIDHDFKGDYQLFVDHLFKKSQLMKNNKKIFVNKKNYHKDPGVSYGESLISTLAEIRADLLETYDSIDNQERYLCAAKLRMEEDMPNYSDANFTMRLSYGQVGEYLLAGQPSGYYTEASSIVKKMEQGEKGVIDYEAEPIMKELLSAKDFGKYTDKTTGKLHLCFLSNNDITGGNSGSPMFNGKGELIGLAFDGNWDSLSSDIFFDKQLARCIGVDIRYVLYMMEKWGKADRLIKEINAK